MCSDLKEELGRYDVTLPIVQSLIYPPLVLPQHLSAHAVHAFSE